MLFKKALLTSLFLVSQVHASCTPITQIPINIDKPGTYCLVKNFTYPGQSSAITIRTSGIVLDFQGHSISSNISDNTAIGIYTIDQQDITIRNGNLNGFFFGIYLADTKGSSTGADSRSGGHIIEKMVIKNSLFRGIRLEGIHNTVRACTISDTGGTSFFPNSFAIGIELIGPSVTIDNNVVNETYACGIGESVGIAFSNNCNGASASFNKISNTKRTSTRCSFLGHSFGIWVGGNSTLKTNAYIRNNIINGMHNGFSFSSPTTGWYGYNQITNATCKYTIASTTVSTFSRRGPVECGFLLAPEELNLINEQLMGPLALE